MLLFAAESNAEELCEGVVVLFHLGVFREGFVEFVLDLRLLVCIHAFGGILNHLDE